MSCARCVRDLAQLGVGAARTWERASETERFIYPFKVTMGLQVPRVELHVAKPLHVVGASVEQEL